MPIKINNEEVYIKTSLGEYKPLGKVNEIPSIEIEQENENDNVLIGKIFQPMKFECKLNNVIINKRILLELCGITNNRLKMKHLPMIRKSVKERKRWRQK